MLLPASLAVWSCIMDPVFVFDFVMMYLYDPGVVPQQ